MVETQRETAWLIETARNTYWDGRQVGQNAHFTDDVNAACRFARFQDAEIVRCWLLDERGNKLRSTEHVWMAAIKEET